MAYSIHSVDTTFLSVYFAYLFLVFFFFLMIRRPPRSTLFPYTTSSDLGRLAGYALVLFRKGSAVVRLYSKQDERSEEHTSESSHITISYAVFCLKKKK